MPGSAAPSFSIPWKTRMRSSCITWAPKLVEALRKRPELQEVSSDQQDQGLRLALDIDRSTASRFGIQPQLIDDTLYDAFGQRIISTIFTQLNQYRVILGVKPEFQQDPANLGTIYLQGTTGGQVPLSAITRASRDDRAAPDQPPGTVPFRDRFLQPGTGGLPGRGRQGRGRNSPANRVFRPASGAAFRERPRPSRPPWPTNPC